jgi:hypothetical protein
MRRMRQTLNNRVTPRGNDYTGANTDKPVGHDNEDPSKGLTRDELSDYKELQNRLRNGEELNPVDAERHAQLAEIRNIELNANSLSQAGQEGAPTRNTQEEIRRLRDIDSLNDLNAAAFVGLRTIDANESPAMTAANENNPKNNRLQIAGGYENSNLFDRFTQSISNTFMGRGFFLNDRELVRRDQSRMGARGELNMVSELGYNLTEEQINNKNRLSIIDREKERIRQSYNFTDGHINVNRINRGDRLIYNRIHLDELSLARSVELDRVRAERVYTQPATDRRPGDQEGANRGRGESGHTEQVGSYFPAYDMNNVPRGSFPLGTPYRPVFNGVVDSRLYGELNDGYGNQIRIDHGHGVSTLYAHNSELLVLPGDRVDDNTVIAAVGNTGSVSPQPTTANPEAGTHIHFELRIGGVRYESVNFDWNRFAIEGQTYVNEFRRNHR